MIFIGETTSKYTKPRFHPHCLIYIVMTATAYVADLQYKYQYYYRDHSWIKQASQSVCGLQKGLGTLGAIMRLTWLQIIIYSSIFRITW